MYSGDILEGVFIVVLINENLVFVVEIFVVVFCDN